ncbi:MULTISPECIES: homocysteine S-methyltransferase family protein [unclassified Thermosipho (in: thermotogales)]|uniref:homocysteine S-methyltransferase family protein n=1 Tax=unclassified Thermosipho (in: thermotogales) TaxID=2676525 RepID=UPI001E31C724|nr:MULTISPECIES: homocysteine S-methyltransferase family protein [unclassified Thermosipho (in: thermotogales)]
MVAILNRNSFLELLNQRVLFLDGAYGTEFFKKGFKGPVEILNIVSQEKIYDLQKSYVEAGVDFLLTNTFSANRFKLKSLGVRYDLRDINHSAVKIAKKAAGDNVYVLGDISSTGVLIEPFGKTTFDEVYSVFKEQGEILLNSGVDGFIIETMTDLKELKAAVFALRDLSNDVPIIAQMSFEENGVSITGTSVEIFATLLNDLDVDVIGVNCTLDPVKLLFVFKKLASFSQKPLSVEPNAGKPKLKNKELIYQVTPGEFARYMVEFVEFGANIVGGCCGTSPEHIRYMINFVGRKSPKKRRMVLSQYISNRTRLRKVSPFLVIGEKINAFGRKKFQENIKVKNFERVVKLARLQEQDGAHVLDVNLGIEKLLSRDHFKKVVLVLDKIGALPLSLDIQEFEFMKVALKEYVGRPIVNSAKADLESLDKAIYLLKRYGGMLILLAMKDKIPQSAEERFNISLEAISYLEKNGIPKERIFVDPLVLPLSTGNNPNITLKTIKLLAKRGILTSIGLSNLSFGILKREAVNSAFLSLAMEKGLNAAILNTSESCTMNVVYGNLFLRGIKLEKLEIKEDPIVEMILKNDEEGLRKEIDKLLKTYTPFQIMQDILSKAITRIGDLYSNGKIFLPQFMISMETIVPIFDYLNSLIPNEEKGKTVLLATVEGDVHDIGKKIVKVVLKSVGFHVIDLGENVPSDVILKKVKEYTPDILGLSTMMTTTIKKIKEVKELLEKEKINIPIIAGGASMNEEIAKEFGVIYGKNAIDALNKIKDIINEKL